MLKNIKKGYLTPQVEENDISLTGLLCQSHTEAESSDTYNEQEWGGTWN